MRRSKLDSTTALLVIVVMGVALLMPLFIAGVASASTPVINEYSIPTPDIEPDVLAAGGEANTWAPQASGTTNDLYGVSALNANHAWAVGENGTILFYNGTSWSRQASGTTYDLHSVSAADTTHVWAVGESGTIIFYNGSSWKPQDSGTYYDLYSVSAVDATHVWTVAGGQDDNGFGFGTIFFFNGTSWSPQYNATSYPMSVSAVDATHVWAVGDELGGGHNCQILFYNGTSWTEQAGATPSSTAYLPWILPMSG